MELIALAKDICQADARGEALGLTDDEIAFYDALEANDSAVKVLGDETLQTIARVKRILRKYGYPHTTTMEKATLTVLTQPAWVATDWIGQP